MAPQTGPEGPQTPQHCVSCGVRLADPQAGPGSECERCTRVRSLTGERYQPPTHLPPGSPRRDGSS